MFAAVPILVWLIAAIIFRRLLCTRKRDGGGRLDDWIGALLLASVAWGAYLTLISEALSLAGALRFGPVLASWMAPIPVLIWLQRRRRGGMASLELPSLTPIQIGLVAIVALFVAATGIVAAVSAPNTWDSMTYHLPRVMHWAQNGSLAHYPTHEPRQLYMSPWAELAATHFQILSGGDRFANLIQWFAMAGGLLAVGRIAGNLGAGTSGRLLAALTAVTLPVSLLQAVSTQTDHVAGFFVLCTVAFLPRGPAPATGLRPWGIAGKTKHLWGAAGATALAVLAKATAYFFLAPFLAVFAWRQLRGARLAALRPLLVLGSTVLILNLGHYARNFELFDSPLQPRGLGPYHQYANETFGPGVTVSGFARGAALHLPGAHETVRALHGALGLDPEDPRTTWPDARFEPAPARVHEDFSGNPPHGLLILGCLLALSCSRALRAREPGLALHALLTVVAVLLFVSVLKWTPWSARLHLPIFLLFAPVVGTLLERLPRLVWLVLTAVLVAWAVPFVASNPLHPVRGPDNVFSVPRARQAFLARPLLGEFYRGVEERIAAAGCSRVGLAAPPDSWEYPLWNHLRRAVPSAMRVESLAAGNASAKLADPAFGPCAVVCVNCIPPWQEQYRTRFGEPVLAGADDLAGRYEHLLFVEPSGPADGKIPASSD
ncbi:MAG: hypothetical protein GY719_17745 [bacterium]|nr:hypothetical protein [bacterium]